MAAKLSIVIPCYNEERTLKECVERVLEIADEDLSLELIIVDDHSIDNSYSIAKELEVDHKEIKIHRHKNNEGKGSALRSGFKMATGDFIAVQDADLEYNPYDMKRLIVPLVEDNADVVFGSRFLSSGTHRVLYFWHSLGNRFLTFLSNMFTDLNLTDMETCYKVFRKDVIKNIDIKENRFGFEPEIVAKVAQRRLRIYEMGISYYGRTYAEGKKIGIKDGLRALYCIFRYNAHKAPIPIQFFLYLFIGGTAALSNLVIFLILISSGVGTIISAPIAFIIAAIVNYLLCITLLFRHKAKWNFKTEILSYAAVVAVTGLFDLGITALLISLKTPPGIAKIIATFSIFILNFIGRRFIVFPEKAAGSWSPQISYLQNTPNQSEKNKYNSTEG
jgi:glycosyltransferase involved in cell wall biosynthesis